MRGPEKDNIVELVPGLGHILKTRIYFTRLQEMGRGYFFALVSPSKLVKRVPYFKTLAHFSGMKLSPSCFTVLQDPASKFWATLYSTCRATDLLLLLQHVGFLENVGWEFCRASHQAPPQLEVFVLFSLAFP